MATATVTELMTAEELVILIVKPGDTFGRQDVYGAEEPARKEMNPCTDGLEKSCEWT